MAATVALVAALAGCARAQTAPLGHASADQSRRDGAVPSSVLATNPSPYATTGPSTASALASARWTEMPPAPIKARSGSAFAWSGREVLIWGGANDSEYGDGAAYDTARNSWRRLAASPLGPRMAVASVWTGSAWFLWGGQRDVAALSDGALYDPAADAWTALPASPLSARGGAVAVWNGKAVVVLGGWKGGRASTDTVDGAAYNPQTRSWRSVPPAPGVPVHTLLDVQAVAAGTDIYVWAQWANTVQVSANSTETSVGVTALRFDTNTWQWSVVDPDQHRQGVRSPLWTGRELLIPASQDWRRGQRTGAPRPRRPPSHTRCAGVDSAGTWSRR